MTPGLFEASSIHYKIYYNSTITATVHVCKPHLFMKLIGRRTCALNVDESIVRTERISCRKERLIDSRTRDKSGDAT